MLLVDQYPFTCIRYLFQRRSFLFLIESFKASPTKLHHVCFKMLRSHTILYPTIYNSEMIYLCAVMPRWVHDVLPCLALLVAVTFKGDYVKTPSLALPYIPSGPKPEVRSQEHPHKLKSPGMSRGKRDHDPLTTARHGLGFRNQQWGAFVVPRLHPFRGEEKRRRATLPEII